MSIKKSGLLTVAGDAIGILTLRTLRQRRGTPEDEEEPAAEAVQTGPQAAVACSTAASRARAAGEKPVDVVAMEADEMRTRAVDDEDETEPLTPVRRVRRVGKGWIPLDNLSVTPD